MDNENHNISNIICNTQDWNTGTYLGIGKTNSPDCIWMGATQVTDIPFGFSFLENFKKIRASYWGHLNTPLPEKRNYNT